MLIKIFTLGGTIDKVYFDKKSRYEVGPPSIKSILDELNTGFKYSVESLLKKDSLDMTDRDRSHVLNVVKADKHVRIIITHGTDTIIDTAKRLKDAALDKVIVLTGAIEPAMSKRSDAVFNIGCSVAAVQILDPGVYIVMNGLLFDPYKVKKDRNSGRFLAK